MEPQADARDLEQREETRSGLVVASADGAEALQLVEAELNEIAGPIELAVERQSPLALGLGVDDGLDAASLELGAKFV